MEWQPIETAPKNRHVLVATTDPGGNFGCRVVMSRLAKYPGGSWGWDHTGARWTHWMEIPQPPVVSYTLNSLTSLTSIMVAANPKLGVGIYTVAEAAFYARIKINTLNRWLFGDAEGDAVLYPERGDDRLVTFVDFVEAMAVRAIRLDHKIPLQKIRQAVKAAEEEYEQPHPLARQHVTYLYGKELFIRLPADSRSPEEQLVQISGKYQKARLMKTLVELYLRDVAFDATGLANHFTMFERYGKKVTMDPRLRFGEPMLPCGYSVLALWEASQAEGSTEMAARAFGVPEEDVNLACLCYDHLVESDKGRDAA